ncbi:phage tail tube protein [Pseudomonas kurunegalensis]|uniref:phage tail tube protein n=1 Tax=Pseudomonas kurunegalensis TaxID=485880 RepID=UPI0028948900|nr:phage tail tube protein [Pseudomonas kurunegalensis]MDT3750496.1 phage tail tube protein [Pseudomonas kurunegalensis]
MAGKKSKSQTALELKLGMTKTEASDPAAADLVYVELGATIKDIDLQGGQTDENETTTFASEGKEYEGGLSDGATVALNGNWAQGSESHEEMMKAADDKRNRAWRIKHRDGSTGRFIAFVKQYTYKAAAGGTLAATFSLRVSGNVKWDPAPEGGGA